MASNPKDPMSRFYAIDIANNRRSNFNWSYKNRLSADFGYLYPVGLWDVPADVHFELDLLGVLSSNPTIAPVLGKVKFRVEAYFVEKAAYQPQLKRNDRLDVSRNVAWPNFFATGEKPGGWQFCARGSLLEYLQMLPAGFYNRAFNNEFAQEIDLNGIPLLMYYDIYRNYYVNPQDDNIPIRIKSFVPQYTDGGTTVSASPIKDSYVTREEFDSFIADSVNSLSVNEGLSSLSADLANIGFLGVVQNGDDFVPTERDHQRYKHLGLLRRTLNNDFFTSFVSNDNVEIMRSRANVQINNNVLNVEQISLANRNWRVATRSLLWGTDWKDYNKVHYGVNIMIPYGRPQFLGALSSDVSFNDVISQAQTGSQADSVNSNVNLGSRAGLAYGAVKNHNGRFVEFNTKDEGYVMVLCSLVPEVNYYQGIDPMYFKTALSHSWMVEYNSVGMQDFMRLWQTAIPDIIGNVPISIEDWNVADHKVPIWFEYMARYHQLHGDFTSENKNRYWVFSRPFNNLRALFGDTIVGPLDSSTDPYLSTYVLPEMFNYIFANNVGEDNFQLQFNFNCKVSSMLDKQVIVYL